MQTPVFIDSLPDAGTVTGRKSRHYQLTRNRALAEILLDESITWTDRDCPACGENSTTSGTFSTSFMPFQRCSACNSIYARQVPDQSVLDELRLRQAPSRAVEATVDEDRQSQEFEFVSLLNWISLTDMSGPRRLARILDYRFTSSAPEWEATVHRLSTHRDWTFLPLKKVPAANTFADLTEALETLRPDAVLLTTEMDRVADPARLLRVIVEAAPKGTLVFVASSCADGLEYEILGGSSPSFIPLDRLTVFSIKGFETLVSRLGYSVLERSTPGRRDAVILERHFKEARNVSVPFWSAFFREADRDRLNDLQILLQRSLRSSFMRFILET